MIYTDCICNKSSKINILPPHRKTALTRPIFPVLCSSILTASVIVDGASRPALLSGFTTVLIPPRTGNISDVKYYLNKGIDINSCNQNSGNILLYSATISGNIDLV